MTKRLCLAAVCLLLATGSLQAKPNTTNAKIRDTVKVVRNITYATYGDRKVTLDLYLPNPKTPSKAKIPCIMTIHGGGWQNGDTTKFAHFARAFAENGLAAACITYRLLPLVGIPQRLADLLWQSKYYRSCSSVLPGLLCG